MLCRIKDTNMKTVWNIHLASLRRQMKCGMRTKILVVKLKGGDQLEGLGIGERTTLQCNLKGQGEVWTDSWRHTVAGSCDTVTKFLQSSWTDEREPVSQNDFCSMELFCNFSHMLRWSWYRKLWAGNCETSSSISCVRTAQKIRLITPLSNFFLIYLLN
jgi:hypothetical protein